MALRRAVFLDRDGTITEEVGHLRSVEQLRLIDGAAEAIARLRAAGFLAVLVTNQAGIARGYLSEHSLRHIHAAMHDMLRARRARLDAVYYCPHHPSEGVPPYRRECDCRKPRPGMLKKAAQQWGVNLGESFVVGDKISDLDAGYAVMCKTVLVRTGYGRQMEADFAHHYYQPLRVADDLAAAAQWILTQEAHHESDLAMARQA